MRVSHLREEYEEMMLAQGAAEGEGGGRGRAPPEPLHAPTLTRLCGGLPGGRAPQQQVVPHPPTTGDGEEHGGGGGGVDGEI